MPKSDQEATAVALAIKNWGIYSGCKCSPAHVPEGKGYDLECKHRHVEVKGTTHVVPGFRSLTEREFDAARSDRRFELWLVTETKKGKGTFHVISAKDIVSSAEPKPTWHLPLGKARLEKFREVALARERKKKRGKGV